MDKGAAVLFQLNPQETAKPEATLVQRADRREELFMADSADDTASQGKVKVLLKELILLRDTYIEMCCHLRKQQREKRRKIRMEDETVGSNRKNQRVKITEHLNTGRNH